MCSFTFITWRTGEIVSTREYERSSIASEKEEETGTTLMGSLWQQETGLCVIGADVCFRGRVQKIRIHAQNVLPIANFLQYCERIPQFNSVECLLCI